MRASEMVMLIPIIISVALFAMVGFIVAVKARARQRQAELQAQVQTRLIERFGSAPELVTFLQTPEGKDFLGGVQSAPALHARDRIVSTMGRAIILGLLGLGFLAMCIWDETRNEGFVIAGCILLALGIGYFLAGLLSIKLSRNWGLMDQRQSS
jgi:hypothetical protein